MNALMGEFLFPLQVVLRLCSKYLGINGAICDIDARFQQSYDGNINFKTNASIILPLH